MTAPRITIDEIHAMLTQIARDPEAGAERFRALKMLTESGTTVVALPEPMNADEVIDRVVRMMCAVGPDLCRLAYSQAFRNHRAGIHAATKLTVEDLPPEQKAKVRHITSLKILYRDFPEIKPPTGGVPRGYPTGRGLAAQRAWMQRCAARILLDREQDAHDLLAGKEPSTDGRVDTAVP